MAGKITRAEIVEAADGLIYQHGYDHTSFADIAEAVGISRGNFYYHFRTKDEILDAVIERRLAATGALLDCWETESDGPAERIRSFILILIMNRTKILNYGCPVGTLSAELAKLEHASRSGAMAIFNLFRIWLRRQFTLLGRPVDADALAMHVLARSQGIASLANAFRDEAFLRHEVDLLLEWLEVECPPAAPAD